MGLADNVREIRDVQTCGMQESAAVAWIKQWKKWCGHSAADALCHFSQTNCPYVRYFEELGYERSLGDILRPLGGSLFSDWPQTLAR